MSASSSLHEASPGESARAARTADIRQWSGPATHLAAERDRLRALTWDHLDLRRLSPTIGAEVRGIDLCTELDPAVVAEIDSALAHHKVLVFRDQALTPEQHLAFARRFGELEVHPFIPSTTGYPELVRFAKSADVAGYENSWHHDVTWRARPSRAAVLHAIEVPDVGGDTLFSDMTAAYDALDDDLRRRIDGLDAAHDFTRTFGRFVDPAQRDAMRTRYPVAVHPVVATHPTTGRKALYVNRSFTSHIIGVPAAESDALLTELCRQAETVEHQVRITWTPDAVAMWDNLSAQHYATSDYWPDVRVMERASIVGARPSR